MNTLSPTTTVIMGHGCPPVSSLSFSSFGSDDQSSQYESPLKEQLRPAYQGKNHQWDAYSTTSKNSSSGSSSTASPSTLSSSSAGSAGIFIDNPDGKPMPMTTGRLILPSFFSFRRQTRRLSTGMFTMGGSGKSRSASILRRTGSDDSCVFSDPMNELKASRYLYEQAKEEQVEFTSATATSTGAAEPMVMVEPAFCSSWDCSRCSYQNSCVGGMEPVCARCGEINSKFQKIQNFKLQQRMSSRSVASSLKTKRWWKRWKELSEIKLQEQQAPKKTQQHIAAPRVSLSSLCTAARRGEASCYKNVAIVSPTTNFCFMPYAHMRFQAITFVSHTILSLSLFIHYRNSSYPKQPAAAVVDHLLLEDTKYHGPG